MSKKNYQPVTQKKHTFFGFLSEYKEKIIIILFFVGIATSIFSATFSLVNYVAVNSIAPYVSEVKAYKQDNEFKHLQIGATLSNLTDNSKQTNELVIKLYTHFIGPVSTSSNTAKN